MSYPGQNKYKVENSIWQTLLKIEEKNVKVNADFKEIPLEFK